MKKVFYNGKYLILFLFICFISTTVAYAGLSTRLAVTGEAKFEAKADIRVTDVQLSGTTNGATVQYEPTYDIDSTTMGFILPNAGSSITYKVTVTNYGDVDQTIYEIIEALSNNSNVKVEVTGYNVKDIIDFESTIEFYITFTTTNPSDEVINKKIDYDFRKVYRVEYNANGGSNVPQKQIKYEREDLKLTSDIPTRVGYTFLGWTDEKSGTTVKYKKDGIYTLDKDILLYAIWDINTVTIHYNTNGGTVRPTGASGNNTYAWTQDKNGLISRSLNNGDMTPDFQVINYGLTVDLFNYNSATVLNITKTGYTAISTEEWKCLSNNCKRQTYNHVGSYELTELCDVETASCTVEMGVNWKANAYTITLNGNGQTKAGTASVTATYDSNILNPASITLPEKKYTISGFEISSSRNSDGAEVSSTTTLTSTYDLVGWYTEKDNGIKVLDNLSTPTLQKSVSGYTDANGKWIKDGATTFYAQWRNTNATKKLPTIEKTGYECGWTENENGTTITYASGSNYTPTKNTTLYGVCTANTYTVTLDKQSGTGGTNTIYQTYDSKYSLTNNGEAMSANANPIEKPKRTGYTFAGYYTEVSGGTQYINANGYLTANASTKNFTTNGTLYARWTINKVYIRLSTNSGTIQATTSSADGKTTNSWTQNNNSNNGLISKSTNGGASSVYQEVINYGATQASAGLANYNNAAYINITKTGYAAESKAEWICLTGCTTQNKKFDQNAVYNASDFCDASNGNCTVVLGVNWKANTYTIGYTLNGGSNPSSNPTKVTYDSDVHLTNPTKTFKVTINANSQGATITDASGKAVTSASSAQTFEGWSGLNVGENALTGASANPATAWAGAKTKNTYFKNLRDDTDTVTMVANWTAVNITLPTITKTGYTCGYATTATGDIAYASKAAYKPSVTAASATLYAKCTPNTYTIGYTLNGGSNPSSNPTKVTYDTDVHLTNPTKTFKVTINANSQGATITDKSGKAVTSASSAQTFAGWSSTTVGENALTGASANPATAWAGAKTTNTYFKNLRDDTDTVTMVANWTAVNIILPTITKTGYTCGYATTATGKSSYASGAEYIPSITTASATLYAKCTPNIYKIGYTLNGGSNPSSNPTSGTYDSDVHITNPTKTFKVTINENGQGATITDASGKAVTSASSTQTFVGWSGLNVGENALTGASANPATAWAGAKTTNTYFKNLRDDTDTVTMVANWKAVKVKLPTITKTGYTCGYATTATGKVAYASGAEYIPSVTTASATLYAKCTANTVTIRYNANGGTVKSPTVDGDITYTWTQDKNGLISKSTNGGAAVTDIQVKSYGNVENLANYNNAGYLYITKTGYKAKSQEEWICLSSSCKGKTYNHNTNYELTEFCDIENTSCIVEVGVNWEPNTYTIGYTLNGGSNPSTNPTKVKYDSDVHLTNPTKTFKVTINANSQGATLSATSASSAQTFAGWSGSNVGENALTGASANPATAWAGAKTKNTYFKNLRDDTDTVTMVANWTAVKVKLPTITKTGYTCGYATTATGKSSYASGAEYIPSVTTASATLYAVCTAKTYTITLDGNGATKAGTASIKLTYNSSTINPASITLPEREYTVSNFGLAASRNSDGATVSSTSTLTSTYTLTEWDTTKPGGIKIMDNSKTPTLQKSVSGYTDANGNWIKDGATTFYAQWTAKAVKLPTITKTGYTCGWTTSATGTTITYATGASYTPTANTQLYGVCTPKTYTITLDGNGATKTGTASIKLTYNSSTINPASITLPERKYTVSNFGLAASRNSDGATVSSTSTLTSTYKLTEWDTKKTGGIKIMDNSKTPTLQKSVSGYTDANGNWIKDGATTFYAQWTAKAVKLPTITKTGYTCGWTTSATGTKITNASGSNYTPTANTQLYGVCTPNTVTIHYNTNGGTIQKTTATADGSKTYTWTQDANGLISKSINGGTATTNVTVFTYGEVETADLANYNSSTYMNITKTGYTTNSNKEWICLNGCTTANKVFSHSTQYKLTDYCDVEKASCTIELGVNWVDKTAPDIKISVYKYDSTKTNNLGASIKALSANASYSDTTWRNYGYTFKLESSDSGSGLSKSTWSYNDSGSATLNKTLTGSSPSNLSGSSNTKYPTLTGNGVRYATFTVEDNAGNSRTVTITVYIDKVTPSTTITAYKPGDSSTTYASNTWAPQGLNFNFLSENTNVGLSGAMIYYCIDKNDPACTPSTTTHSTHIGEAITDYNTTEGIYYVRYFIRSTAGNQSAVKTYTVKVDSTTPSTTITSYKSGDGDTTYKTNVWSPYERNFIFKSADTKYGDSGATIYYCGDRDNKCNPTQTVAKDTAITSYNDLVGTYYIRYKIVSGAGKSSAVKSYTAKVDKTTPSTTITSYKLGDGNTTYESNVWSSNGRNFTFKAADTKYGDSGATIYYCGDRDNTCNPTQTVAVGAAITSFNTLTGTYYIRYKIVSGAGESSAVKSYTAKIGTYSQDASCGVLTKEGLTSDTCVKQYGGACREGSTSGSNCTCKYNATCWH